MTEVAYYETLLQEDINVGVGTAQKRNPGGGTLVGTQVGIHSWAVGQAAFVAPWTIGEVASLGSDSVNVACQGAAGSDFVMVSYERPLGGLLMFAEVVSANTVTVRVFNPTTSAIELADENDLRILIFKSR